MGAKGEISETLPSRFPGDGDPIKIRLDKRVASGALHAHEYSLYLSRLPMLMSCAVTKMENAKNRVLLPTDVIHYYIGCFVL